LSGAKDTDLKLFRNPQVLAIYKQISISELVIYWISDCLNGWLLPPKASNLLL